MDYWVESNQKLNIYIQVQTSWQSNCDIDAYTSDNQVEKNINKAKVLFILHIVFELGLS